MAKVPTFTKPMASTNSNETRKGQGDVSHVFRTKGTVSIQSNIKKYRVKLVRDNASARTVTSKKTFLDIKW